MKRIFTFLFSTIFMLTFCTGAMAQNRVVKIVKGGQVVFSSNIKDFDYITVKSSYIGGHEYVDLGLPSGLKWATCNVGASKPEEYGNHYAWGETTTKSSYDISNSLTYGKSSSELQSGGIIDGNGNLTPEYDAARKNWGGSWRMPTKAEMQELIDNCTTEWITLNGRYGRKVTSKKNGKSIFIPACGWRYGGGLSFADDKGNYWTSSQDGSYSGNYLYFDSGSFNMDSYRRSNGFSVRPVSE
ncbi:MAG: hypothetical protein HUK08_08005 [Bacteroidaceae bacterium]|nr:hypothetical protein [Bacteroidaceae bacterium]